MVVGDAAPRAQVLSSRGLRLWLFLALPAADDGPLGVGDLHRRAAAEVAVNGAFFGSDSMRDAALTRIAALRSDPRPLARACAKLMTLRNPEYALAIRQRHPAGWHLPEDRETDRTSPQPPLRAPRHEPKRSP